MGINFSSILPTNSGLLPISLLSTDNLITFCTPGEHINVNYMCDSFQNTTNIIQIFNLNTEPNIRINVTNNYSIKVSADQLILTTTQKQINNINDCSWKKAQDITINDNCIIKKFTMKSINDIIKINEITYTSNLDRILESSESIQKRYLQKLFDKYATVVSDKIFLSLYHMNEIQREQIHLLLLSFGIISNLTVDGQICIDNYLAVFKDKINFSNRKQNTINEIYNKNEINYPLDLLNSYIILPVISKDYLINDDTMYQVLLSANNNEDNSFVANGFVLKALS